MRLDNIEEVLRRVREYCESLLRLEGRPSDDSIETAKEVLKLINLDVNKK
jgi:C4-type Zn-finger protein